MEQMAEMQEARRSTVPSSAPARMTGAQILWEVLAREGVEVVFGYPGERSCRPTTRSRRAESTTFSSVTSRARRTWRTGTRAPPGRSGLHRDLRARSDESGDRHRHRDARLDPVVCITGQVSSSLLGSDAFQEIDITGITLPITKHNYLVTRAEDLAHTLREAFEVARSGRPGPVLVDITKDAQQATVPFRWSDEPVRLPGVRPARRLTQEQLERAASLVDQAKRPLLFCGHG
jgi:acetolactate synthase-1/2/3 large subunit